MSLRTIGLDDISDYLSGLPEHLNDAALNAINQTISQHKSRLARLIAARADIPLSALRSRKRVQSKRAKKDNLIGVLWGGFNPIPADEAGRTASQFLGAFEWGGKIFKRRGKSRLPIDRIMVDMRAAMGEMERQEAELARALKENFEKEIGARL
jgi:hypothetical protein